MRAMPNRWKPNVTVAAVVEREGRFLFIEENTADGLRLNNPAGHLDPGESPVDACVREVLEETAYDFTPSALVGVYLNRFRRTRTGDDITYLRFAFGGEITACDAQRPLDHGIIAARWLTRGADAHRVGQRLPRRDQTGARRRLYLQLQTAPNFLKCKTINTKQISLTGLLRSAR